MAAPAAVLRRVLVASATPLPIEAGPVVRIYFGSATATPVAAFPVVLFGDHSIPASATPLLPSPPAAKYPCYVVSGPATPKVLEALTGLGVPTDRRTCSHHGLGLESTTGELSLAVAAPSDDRNTETITRFPSAIRPRAQVCFAASPLIRPRARMVFSSSLTHDKIPCVSSPFNVVRRSNSTLAWTPWAPNKPKQIGPVTIVRRNHSNWAWTPWAPNKPKQPPTSTSPPALEDVVKFLKELKEDSAEGKIVKDILLDKYYSGRAYDPETAEMKVDLLLHGQKLTLMVLRDIEQQLKQERKWSFRIFGKNIDVSGLLAFLGMF